MPTQNSAGSQTATIDTEHSLAAITVDGTYMLYVDLTNMAAGDRTIIKAKVKIASAGAERVLIEDVILGDDVVAGAITPLYYVPPIPATENMSFTLEQTDGTGRSYDWQVLQV